MSIFSLVSSGNGFTSGRLSYGHASTYRPCPTYFITVLVFVCLYVCTTLAGPRYDRNHFLLLEPKKGIVRSL